MGIAPGPPAPALSCTRAPSEKRECLLCISGCCRRHLLHPCTSSSPTGAGQLEGGGREHFTKCSIGVHREVRQGRDGGQRAITNLRPLPGAQPAPERRKGVGAPTPPVPNPEAVMRSVPLDLPPAPSPKSQGFSSLGSQQDISLQRQEQGKKGTPTHRYGDGGWRATI